MDDAMWLAVIDILSARDEAMAKQLGPLMKLARIFG